MSELEGTVAFITGAARGQGRSHALTLAEAGADIVGLDLCDQVGSVYYQMGTSADLAETERLITGLGRRFLAVTGDVRDREDVEKAVQAGLAEFGRLDIAIANAGIMAFGLRPFPKSGEAWRDTLDVNLTGVWNTLQVAAQVMIDQGHGGSIVLISSSAGVRPAPTSFDGGFDGYVAAKFGVVGLMRTYASALGRHSIRVNTIHPTVVATPMVMNDFFPEYAKENSLILNDQRHAIPVDAVEPADISRAVLYLVGEAGRYVTGQQMAVDAGVTTVPRTSE